MITFTPMKVVSPSPTLWERDSLFNYWVKRINVNNVHPLLSCPVREWSLICQQIQTIDDVQGVAVYSALRVI